MRICKKCVLPESKPHIWLNQDGVCNLCVEHEALGKGEAAARMLETEFVKYLKMYKGRGEHDCLVMCSGGKDSTAALYYMKKRYKRNPLAFTFDHGFETQDALDNVRNATSALGVDLLYYRSDFMKEMFRKVLLSGSRAVICHLCSLWYMDLTFKTAARFDIPVIIAGWTRGQSKHGAGQSQGPYDSRDPEFVSMAEATREFLRQAKTDPRYKDFPESMEEVVRRARKKHRSIVLSPHWFLPYDSSEYVELIKKELGWKFPASSYPAHTTNCELNFISVHNSLKYFGYTHYHVEMSKLIRQGLLSREEALKDLEAHFDPGFLDAIARKLGYSF